MGKPRQPDLFAGVGPLATPETIEPFTPVESAVIRMPDDLAAGVDIGFDFLAELDPRMTPRPGFVTPEWLRLPTDE